MTPNDPVNVTVSVPLAHYITLYDHAPNHNVHRLARAILCRYADNLANGICLDCDGTGERGLQADGVALVCESCGGSGESGRYLGE